MAIAYIMYSSDAYSHITLVNAVIQLVLFVVTACIPAMMTGRISYVDIAWPWGLFVIGVVTAALGQGWIVRKALISF